MKNFSMKNLNDETKFTLIADENYPLDKAYKLVAKGNISMINKFIGRSDITSYYLNKFVNHENFKVRCRVAANPKVSVKDLEVLLDDPIQEVVESAIKNPSITEELLGKLLNNIELLGYNVLIACLDSQKVTDKQIKKIFNYYKENTNNSEEDDILEELACKAISSKNISEETVCDIINFMGATAANDNILQALVSSHPEFETSISTYCIEREYNFFYCNCSYIRYLNKTNLEYMWYNFIKDVGEGDVGDARKELLCCSFARNINLTDEFVRELINFVIKDKNNISVTSRLEKVISKLLENENLSSLTITFLWKVIVAKLGINREKIKEFPLAVDFKNHPKTPKEILFYLRKI